MKRPCTQLALGRSRSGGMTLVEVVISTLILGVMLTAGLSAAGAAASLRARAGQRERADALAIELVGEILRQPYEEPTVVPIFGREIGELSTGRATWNDVDDYSGWSASPPQDADGAAIAGFSSWTRSVSVDYVDPNDLTLTSLSDTGIKRITVRVLLNDLELARVTTIRTNAWTGSGAP